MSIQSIIKRDLRTKATPRLIGAVLVGGLAMFHIAVLFMLGSWLGPLVLWFLKPVPTFLPILSGFFFILMLFIGLFRLDDKWWVSATYDSKSLGEIPLTDAPLTWHGSWGGGLPVDMQVLGPASISLVAKIVSIPLLLGPAALLFAIGGCREAWQLLTVNTRHISDIVKFIHVSGGRVTFEALEQAFDQFHLRSDMMALLLIDGVVLLEKEMNGVALAARLREQIAETAGQLATTES